MKLRKDRKTYMKVVLSTIIIFFVSIATFSQGRQVSKKAPSQDKTYKNRNLPISQRVEKLMAQMTLKEKLAQTHCIHLYDDMLDEDGNLIEEGQIKENLPYGFGQLGKPNWAFDKSAKESAEITNRIQREVIKLQRR